MTDSMKGCLYSTGLGCAFVIISLAALSLATLVVAFTWRLVER